jgi:hypothetical protein
MYSFLKPKRLATSGGVIQRESRSRWQHTLVSSIIDGATRRAGTWREEKDTKLIVALWYYMHVANGFVVPRGSWVG